MKRVENLHKISIKYFILISLICFAVLGFNSFKNPPKNILLDAQKIAQPNVTKSYTDNNTTETPIKEPSEEKKTSGPIIKDLPWENDEAFVKSLQENNTPLLLAAYRTVLRDPLPGEEYNVHLGARMLAGKIIKPGEIFSQNAVLGPYTISKGFKRGPTYIGPKLSTTIGGGVCKIASTLYNVTILSNLQIMERHAHSMPVPYVPYGQDATVSYGNKDFKFKNNTSNPITIWAQGIDNTLYMAFYGSDTPPKVEWHHEVLQVKKAPKIYNANPELEPGIEKLVLEGMDGAVVKSWLTITNADNSVLTKDLGKSNYNPMAYIYERSK